MQQGWSKLTSGTVGFFKDVVHTIGQVGGQLGVGSASDEQKTPEWTHALKRKLEDIANDDSNEGTNHTLAPILAKISAIKGKLQCEVFSYRSKRDETEARSILLKIIQKLITGIVADDGSKNHALLKSWEDRELWFNVTDALFNRREFDLERAGFQVPRRPFVDAEIKGQFSSYRWLLIAILNHSRTSFGKSRAFLEDPETGRWKMKDYEMKFYMNILALAFFRIPLIQGRVTNAIADALENRPWSTPAPNGENDTNGSSRSRSSSGGENDGAAAAAEKIDTTEASTKDDTSISSNREDASPIKKTLSKYHHHRHPRVDMRKLNISTIASAQTRPDDIDRAVTLLRELSSIGYCPSNGISLDVEEVRNLYRNGNETMQKMVRQNKETERMFCDCSPSLFDWINLQTEDHKRLLNAQECAIARSSMVGSKGDLKSLRELGWDWLDLVVRNGECFALFTIGVVENVVRHAGKGRDPMDDARTKARRNSGEFGPIESSSSKSKQMFGALLRRGGNMLGHVVGSDKEKKKHRSNRRRIPIAWHMVPAYHVILKLLCRLLHKMCVMTRSSPPSSISPSRKMCSTTGRVTSSRGAATISSPPNEARRGEGISDRWTPTKSKASNFVVVSHLWPRIERTPRCMSTVLEASVAMLANANLLDLFVRISFSCTSVYDFRAVERCLDRVGKFFISAAAGFRGLESRDGGTRWQTLQAMVCMGAPPTIMSSKISVDRTPRVFRRLPASFDEDYFMSGVRILLESEHAQTLVCVLRFLYQQMTVMSDPLRMRIMRYILERHVDPNTGVIDSVFIKLFCSWHDDVRRVFHHILVYRAFRVKRTFLSLVSDKMLIGSSKSRHLLFFERPPDVVKQSIAIANDTTLAFGVDFFIDQLVKKQRVIKTRRRSGARIAMTPKRENASSVSATPPSKPPRSHNAGSISSEAPYTFKEAYYVYGKMSLVDYTKTLSGYYTRALASSSGVVDAVDMAELVFGGNGGRRGD